MIYKIILTVWLLSGFGMCIAGAYGYFTIGFVGLLLTGASITEFIGLKNYKLNLNNRK